MTKSVCEDRYQLFYKELVIRPLFLPTVLLANYRACQNREFDIETKKVWTLEHSQDIALVCYFSRLSFNIPTFEL